ncbi:hypothetical protein QP162_09125 [Sphingomonas aurantiaca]|uniref:hypothetical protein n=1 Tax=Sphingomonas aurantiaca TaxID=185949 RepID=UPI002FDF5F2E
MIGSPICVGPRPWKSSALSVRTSALMRSGDSKGAAGSVAAVSSMSKGRIRFMPAG